MKKYYEIKIKGRWKLAELDTENEEIFLINNEKKKIVLTEERLIKREINIDSRYLNNLGLKYLKNDNSFSKEHIYIKRFDIIENNSMKFLGYFVSTIANCGEFHNLKNYITKINKIKDLNSLAENFSLIKTVNQLFQILEDECDIDYDKHDIIKKTYYEI